MTNNGGLENMVSKKEMQKLINAGKREAEKNYKEQLDKLRASEEYQVAQKLRASGMNPREIENALKGLQRGNPKTGKEYNVGKFRAKYGVISDTHIGSIHYDDKLMSFAAKEFDKHKVDFVLHAGDIVDGWYQNRPSSIFEQNAIGYDQQKEAAIKELSKIKQPLYFITGNHEYNTFVRNAGVELGHELERGLKNKGLEAHYLGNGEGDIKLKNGTTIKLLHPDGGTAYAISYKPQKIIESLEGGKKPHILHIGHFHKAEYLFYRNIHCFQTGTFENQTKFMRGKQIPAHKGFWVVEVGGKQGGQIDYIKPLFYPAYD